MSAASVDNLFSDHLTTMMRRTDRSLQTAGFDALVIQAGRPPVQFLDDQDYPFKVNPHFKAWVPITDNPLCLLVYTPGGRPRVLFHQPDDYWHKPASVPREPWTEAVDIIPMADPAAATDLWSGLGRVAYISPSGSVAGAAPDSINDPALLQALDYDRAVKTPYELECMRRATALGVLGHAAALHAFRRGASEYETHMSYLEACTLREEELPYNSIVAHNEHAAVLHYQHLNRAPTRGLRTLLLDAGAQYRGYASDITRTYAAEAGRFAGLIDALNTAQLRLCDEIVAGKDYREVHLTAHRLLGEVMQAIGLTTIPGEEALRRGVTSVFFPHGIGHLLGLQVHDVGGVQGELGGGERQRPEGHPYLRLTRRLEPGVVVTVEPGIYFIETLLRAARGDPKRRDAIDWAVVEELQPFGGIRIEDNVVTTSSAPENMTREAFAELAAAA